MTQENFFERAKEIMTPSVIEKLGKILNEPEFKVQQDLEHIFPTVLLGIVEEGATLRGSQRLSHLLHEAHPSFTSSPSHNSLQDGEKVTEEFFGSRYYEFMEKLVPLHGLSSKNIPKLLSLITPIALGVLKQLIPEKHSDPLSLYRFLRNQKREHKGYVLFEAGENFRPRRQLPYTLIVILLFIILGSFLWFISKRQLAVSNLKNVLNNIDEYRSPDEVTLSNKKVAQKPLDLPEIEFISGTTDLKREGESVLKNLANLLERRPELSIEILASSEETGDESENLRIAEGRAMLIREELIGLGVEPSRMRVKTKKNLSGKPQISILIQGISSSLRKD